MTFEDSSGLAAGATGPTGLPPEVRRDEITAFINQASRARVEDLAERFGVSAMTIHRDLDCLAREGRLERIRGGARAITARLAERDVRLRRHLNAGVKKQLAATAAALVDEGSVIALDDSTTVSLMAGHLEERCPSTVITHALALMNSVAALPAVSLVGLGGQYYSETDSFLGSIVVEQTRRLTADAVFVSTTSVKNLSLLHPDAEAALTKRGLLQMGTRKILVVDSSKFNGAGLYHVLGLSEFDDVVVDDQLDLQTLAELRALDLNIHIADSSPKG